MTASFTLYFLKDFGGLLDYKAMLRSAISNDRSCQRTKAFQCYGFDRNGPYLYRIPPDSSLFPTRQSPVRIVLENVGLDFWVLKKASYPKNSHNIFYSQVGTFGFGTYNHTPEEWYVEYDWNWDKVALDVVSMEVPDSSLLHSEVLSLADIVPGAMVAAAINTDDRLCRVLSAHHVRDCAGDFVNPLSDGLTIETVDLHFKYPKSLSFGIDGKLPCKLSLSQELLGAFFLNDIDATPYLTGPPANVSSGEKQMLCDGLERGRLGQK
jgi:hypothetical protein